jgi:DNA-directed RNA polymerase specialized sigma24 family protein
LDVTYEEFVADSGPRLRAGLVAAYGPEAGIEAASEALAYGWEHWERLAAMGNPAGYLYRVGQTAARRGRRPQGFLPIPASTSIPEIEPGLVAALEQLSEQQRVVVVLVHGFDWSQAEVAELLDVTSSTVHATLARAVANLKRRLEVETDECRR